MIESSRLEKLRALGYDVDGYHDDVAGLHIAAIRGFGIATMLDLTDADDAIASLLDLDAHAERVRQHMEAMSDEH